MNSLFFIKVLSFQTKMNIWIYAILLSGLSVQCGGEMERSYAPENRICSIRWELQRQIANCTHRNISSVPQNLPHNLHALYLSHNNLSMLLNGSFVNYRQLQTLNAKKNSIAILENGTFAILLDLNALDLSYNRIKVLPSFLLHDNVHLSMLLLSHNKLRRIPNISVDVQKNVNSTDSKEQTCRWNNISIIELPFNDFVKLEQEDFLWLKNCPLHILDLSHNEFTSLPDSIFIYLPPVKKLRLNHISLDTFEVQSFMGKVAIERLFMSFSRIRSIRPLNTTRTSREQFPEIQMLNLQSNGVDAIPDHALLGFEKLQILTLQQNLIYTIRRKSFCGLKSLTHLDLSRNQIKSLPYGSFSCATKIQKIDLSRNQIFTLDPQWFDGSHLLLHLDLHKNKIGEIKSGPWNATNIQILELARNNLDSLHNYMFAGLIQLRRLDVARNGGLVGISNDTFTGEATTLEYLTLANSYKIVVDGSFGKLHRLLYLDLSYTHKKLKIGSAHEFSHLYSLRTLILSRTYLSVKDLVHFDGKTNKSVFSGLASLDTLEMRHNSLHTLPETIFTPLRNISKIDLTACYIEYIDSVTFANLTSLRELCLPDNSIKGISESAFQHLHNLQTLLLQHNDIPLIEKQLFNGTPNLQKLFLQNNKISTMLPYTVIPPQLKIFNISDNKLTCTCQLVWFREWLDEMNVSLINSKDIRCSRDSLQDLENKPILSFHPEEYCGVDILLVAGVSVSIISALSLVILVYVKRWWLNHKLFLLKLAIIGYHEVIENKAPDDYEYQLNIMFDEDDGWWVNDYIKPFLEERMPHFEHIVFGDADLHPGSFYLDAIYDVIEGSYKTVLLLSNQAVADAWFMTKLRMAVEHMNDTKLEKVILIFLEDIDNDHLPYLARLLLSQNKPYLLWVDDEDGRDYFWAKFQKSLSANRQMNNVIPV